MKTKLTLLALALGASTCLVSAQDGPPPSDNQPPPQGEGGPGASGHRGGPGSHSGFHLLPPRAQDQLQLTDDQKKQIAALEADTKAKLEKILTPDQLQKLKDMRPQMHQGGPGGQGRNSGRNNSGGNDMPPGPPPGDAGDGNNPPPGPPPGQN